MPRIFKLIFTAAALWLLIPFHALGQTAEPPREPILRIETGMHTSVIMRIGVDAANRFLVTASDDKTVRIWELATGRLLRVIRVPIGGGNEGRLYAVAISPDGNTVAAGGWTGYEWETAYSIYLFDRESGRMLRRLNGLPNGILHLAFSVDGRFLAATLGGKNGVRVFRTADYVQVGSDADYGDSSLGADFDRTGRLVTASFDGYIRLYAAPGATATGLRRLAKAKAPGGEHPFGVGFSPDGARVAVGFEDSTRVSILSGRDLAAEFEVDTGGVNNGDMGRVAWSADGSTLYAAGRAQDASRRFFIRAWTGGGRGAHRDIPTSASTIMHLVPLRGGGVAFGAHDPAFGVINAAGNRALFQGAGIADYRNLAKGFRLAADGGGVAFAFESFGASPARFSLAGRVLTVDGATPAAWSAPVIESSGLAVTGWYESTEPKLNGAKLPLEQYETSYCLALTPDASTFLLGTHWYLRLFDRTGKERWKVPVPGIALEVNITAEGRQAVAALGDGTIRWYRITDGRELLAFFPHADRKRWVVWTPSGYYDAAPGAEDLIGWHVNNGRDLAADFFPAGQFRDTYYRPDVIARVLAAGDETVALRQANEENGRRQQQLDLARRLPPVVEIVSPNDGSEVAAGEVTVRYRIRSSNNEPITNVRALLNGRPIDGARLLVQTAAGADGSREVRVTVPEGESTVSIIAENQYAASVPASVRLKRRAQTATATRTGPETLAIKPKLYILAVGVKTYANEKFNLLLADKDARDFVATMQAQKGLLYRDVVVKLLINEQATKDEVLDGLDWIRKETTSNDVAMVFFAGHGVNDQNNYYYFCPYNIDPERLLRTGVAFSDIKNTVSAIAGKALFFVDTCHSGNSLGLGGRRGGLDINIVINELSSAENGAIVFSASTGSESSYERAEWNNGAFTKALIEGLNGAAAIGTSGRITYGMLNVYISERVKELTKGQQHPTMISPNTIQDFPVAVRR